ncbi:MAG: hypothetical protein GY832_41070 [Chloroflexi bacterium]|nr:hypothetical protein [Chloroflexota bacterium]
MVNSKTQIPIYVLILTLLLVGCAGKPVSLTDIFPSADTFPDWTPASNVEIFDHENIFDLVNGQAEAFFVYGFEQVAVRDYENAKGAVLGVEVWQLATPADAYGLFTSGISGEPINIGNEGDSDPGRRLAFWQDHYYVHVRARQELPDATLRAFAQTVSMALPAGGERPTLVSQLPPDELVERSAIFFHEELSIQNEVWLGGENLLGLSPETDGVLAQYNLDGTAVRLLLVQYQNVDAAATGLTALENSQIDALIAAHASGNLLGTVFGEADTAAASALLDKALGNE